MTRPPAQLGRPTRAGFTLVELMAVVAVVAILSMIAIPSVQDRVVRNQIVEVVHWAEFAQKPVEVSWNLGGKLPIDNLATGLPAPDLIVSNYVKSLTVENGSLQIVFGNHAMSALASKTLSLRPAVSPGASTVPVAWVCGQASPPAGMTVSGADATNIDKRYLPLNCR
jgi:type IV pilus assembly protein PilA